MLEKVILNTVHDTLRCFSAFGRPSYRHATRSASSLASLLRICKFCFDRGYKGEGRSKSRPAGRTKIITATFPPGVLPSLESFSFQLSTRRRLAPPDDIYHFSACWRRPLTIPSTVSASVSTSDCPLCHLRFRSGKCAAKNAAVANAADDAGPPASFLHSPSVLVPLRRAAMIVD